MAGQKILNTPQMCSKSKDPDPYYEKKADPDLFIDPKHCYRMKCATVRGETRYMKQ